MNIELRGERRANRCLPTDPMLLFRLLVTNIVIRMQILAGGLQRFMPQIVADRAQVNLLISHMRTSGVPKPVSGGPLELIGSSGVFLATMP